MKLAIMTRPTFFVEEDKILEALFEEGLDDLHIYKPQSSPVYVERLLSLLPENTHRRITVHDHFYLKEEFGLAAIHLDEALAERPAGYRGNFSRSCSDLTLLKEAKRKARYVFLSNIFDSLSDPDRHASFTMSELQAASRQGLIDKHVYALSGMSLDTIRAARDLGFGGVVVCGDLWNRFNIHNETDYRSIINHFEKLRSAIG
ncbi:MAG: thiamine phosphate synthase [Prevotella sp.]|nr:thiamine phosphate synthase [Prevotella sp.]